MKAFCFLSTLVLITVFFSKNAVAARSEPLIVGHTAVQEFNNIPDWAIENAKDQFYGVYFHTSHGSQIFTGMDVLMNSNSLYDYFNDHYYYKWPGNPPAPDGDLSIWDWEGTDLGNPNKTAWVNTTRAMLSNSNNDYQIYPHYRNLVMWSWCGQVSSASVSDIANLYLANMAQLEQDYPDLSFIYMTGHLDGTGEGGNLHQRNEQIRQYCRNNNKILFDFADIESYDPSGNYYLNRGGDDQCNYNDGNWADEWCADNSGNNLCASCGTCAHSRCLNCNMKGRAFWWMMARLAGWNGIGSSPAPSLIRSVSSSPSPSSSPESRVGDVNQDGLVNTQDIIDLFSDWGNEPWTYQSDINADGEVNSMDCVYVLTDL